MSLDAAIFLFINKGVANRVFDYFFFYANKLFYLMPVLIGLLALMKTRNLAVLLLIAGIISSTFIPILKLIINRDRPFTVLDARVLTREHGDRSFPSNHAFLSFAIATLVFSFYKRLGSILFLYAFLISFGRIYLGVHYPSDVIAGAVLGILIGVLILKANKIYYKRIVSKARKFLPRKLPAPFR